MNSIPAVLVTGASRGLGRGIALRCARAGFSIAIHYNNNEAAAQETRRLCEAATAKPGQKFVLVRGDVSSTRERSSLFDAVLSSLERLDALVNNAGMAPRIRSDIAEAGEDSYDEVMNVNLKGPYFLSQLAACYWLKHRGQSLLPGGYKLIFISSISASAASINRGEYCLSKAGLSMAAQLWAARLANDGVQVFEIRPGLMETDMTASARQKYEQLIAEGLVPQRRWGTPEDVGLNVETILKGGLPFSTGQIISVDGGLHVSRL